MDRQQATAILYKIYRVLKKPNIKLRFDRKLDCAGEVRLGWFDDNINVTVDPFDTELMSTLLHEALHVAYPDMLEKGILKLEKQVLKLLTDRQLQNLVKRFAALLGGN